MPSGTTDGRVWRNFEDTPIMGVERVIQKGRNGRAICSTTTASEKPRIN
jgi:hypothetical protein